MLLPGHQYEDEYGRIGRHAKAQHLVCCGGKLIGSNGGGKREDGPPEPQGLRKGADPLEEPDEEDVRKGEEGHAWQEPEVDGKVARRAEHHAPEDTPEPLAALLPAADAVAQDCGACQGLPCEANDGVCGKEPVRCLALNKANHDKGAEDEAELPVLVTAPAVDGCHYCAEEDEQKADEQDVAHDSCAPAALDVVDAHEPGQYRGGDLLIHRFLGDNLVAICLIGNAGVSNVEVTGRCAIGKLSAVVGGQ